MSFRPLAPLEPSMTYVVDLGQPPVGPAPDAKVTWQFTTGASLAAPLRFEFDVMDAHGDHAKVMCSALGRSRRARACS
jgi:hypothetical protein